MLRNYCKNVLCLRTICLANQAFKKKKYIYISTTVADEARKICRKKIKYFANFLFCNKSVFPFHGHAFVSQKQL